MTLRSQLGLAPTQEDVVAGLFDIAGRTAIVTGASSGIGRHFALLLAQCGCRVAATARRLPQLESLVGEISAQGGEARAIAMDVASVDSIGAAFAEIARTLPPVSIVVNNAGAALTKPVLDVTDEEWRTIMRTNLSGAWTVSNIAARQMIDNQIHGSIINIGSILGFIAMKAVSAYSVSKAGLLELTQQLAAEFGPHGIRVNAIAPGYVRTALSEEFFARSADRMAARIPLRRFLEPSDLDGPLLLLASDAGRAMTGSTIVVDCGHHISVPEAAAV